MRAINSFLVSIVIIRSLIEATPILSKPNATGKTLLKRVNEAYSTIVIGGGAVSHQFFWKEDWETDKTVTGARGKGSAAVLRKMKKSGLFTAVIMKRAQTTCVGLKEGKTTPDQFVLSNVKNTETCLVTNGGFFVTGGDSLLRTDYNGCLLDSASVMHFSVGPTSVSPNHISIPSVHSKFYDVLQGDDGTFMTCGPDIKKALDASDPNYLKSNKPTNRLHYFAPTWRNDPNDQAHSFVWDEQVKWDQQVHMLLSGKEGVGLGNELATLKTQNRGNFTMKKVTWCDRAAGKVVRETLPIGGPIRTQEPSKAKMGTPVKITDTVPVRLATDGASEFVRSVFAHIPGGIATVNQPNERAVVVFVGGGVKVACAYTSDRGHGMTINEMRDVVSAFLQEFTFASGIENVQQALNLDGGASIFIGWIKNGRLRVLASGDLVRTSR